MIEPKSALGARTLARWVGPCCLLLLLAGGVGAGEEAAAAIAVRLEPGARGSRLAPRYSPKGSRVPLAASERVVPAGVEALEGRLPLGPALAQGDGHLLVLARSEAGRPYDRLWIDANGDGSLADEEMQTAAPRLTRGTVYTSYDAVVQVNHGSAAQPVPQAYPIGLWVAVASEDETPPFVRFSRRGFLAGQVAIDEVAYHVVLSDADNDAVFGAGDWWAILPAEGEGSNDIALSRKVGDFAWADRRAFRLELEGTRGRAGRLVAVDPGLTPEEDARARNPYWDDEHAERAEAPVAFRHDVEAALADAAQRQVPCFLDFETVWCGPCKTMDRWVYTARDVVAAAEGIVCVKVDGDERKDLKERYAVDGFPTGILLRPDGEELARFSGYRSVEAMVAFFARAKATSSGDE